MTLAVGVELTEANAATARAAFDEVIVGSIEAPAVVDALPMFDLTLALDVLEHLVDPATVVRRLVTRLAPGGAFVVSLPHVGHSLVVLPLLLKGHWTHQDEGLLDRTHLRFFDRVSAPALLAENGLTVERLERVIDTGGLFNVLLFRTSRRAQHAISREQRAGDAAERADAGADAKDLDQRDRFPPFRPECDAHQRVGDHGDADAGRQHQERRRAEQPQIGLRHAHPGIVQLRKTREAGAAQRIDQFAAR